MSQSHIDVSALASEACPVSEVLDHVYGKWTIGILVAAAQGPVRFTELERSIRGISGTVTQLPPPRPPTTASGAVDGSIAQKYSVRPEGAVQLRAARWPSRMSRLCARSAAELSSMRVQASWRSPEATWAPRTG
jgi:hypothetical protein